jgi:hypothetical protein
MTLEDVGPDTWRHCWLFDNHLVAEIILLTYPVVIGQGTRLFPATGPDAALDLVDSHAAHARSLIRYSRSGTVFSRPGDPDCESPDAIPSSDRSQPAYQKSSKENPGGGVGSGQRCS